MIDVDELRRGVLLIRGGSESELHRKTLYDVLRILDAFDAMERGKGRLRFDGMDELWEVDDGTTVIAQGVSPLAALLAAADKAKETRDG